MGRGKIRAGVVAFACAVSALAVTAGPARADNGNGKGDDKKAEHARVEAFWTPARVAKAVPRDYVIDPQTGKLKPMAKPAANGGNTAGLSWTKGGAVLQTTGKVLFEMSGSYYVCSASVVKDGNTDNGRSIILTAAHCVIDESNGTFATNWMFIPDYDTIPAPLDTSGSFCAQTRLGCWVADSLVVSKAFADAGGFTNVAILHDYAFAVVGEGTETGAQLDASVPGGGQAIAFGTVSNNTSVSLFGYPAAQKYSGTDLIYSRGPLGRDPYQNNATYKVTSDQTGGSSGGPWFKGFSDTGSTLGTGTLMSINSYGYGGIKAMHGPVLNDETQAMFNVAKLTSANVKYG
ncbi:MAG TPA: hypothetical protein VMS14_00115 [Ilumatobacteraceae bacterium]|nr:hypothetical protein [Ilumatobacteraceae bacterium]